MFDVASSELLVIGVVALIVIGPKELPGVLRSLGQAAGKMRRMAGDFRQQFDDAMREADLHDAKKSMTDAVDSVRGASSVFNPLQTIRNEIKGAVDEIKGAGQSALASAEPSASPVSAAATVEAAPEPVTIVLPDPPALEPLDPVKFASSLATKVVVDESVAPVELPPVKPKRVRKKPAGETA